jgi:phage terminase large subunit
MGKQTVVIPYSPRPFQLSLHDSLKRFNVVVAHRRFGKTTFAVNELIRACITNKLEAPRYAYLAPTYRQAKAIAWDLLKKYAGVIPGVQFNEQELRCDLPNGARIRLFGADNPDSLRGMYLDGVVIDEVSQQHPSLWREVINPMLVDRRGWVLFIGTPMGKNLLYDLYEQAKKDEENWLHATYTVNDTGLIAHDELMRLQDMMGVDEYAQEFLCSFTASVVGSYYGREMQLAEKEGRITSVPYEKSLPVNTIWDLGISDSMSIIFTQQVNKEIRIIDYHEANGEGLDYYVRILQSKGYVYGRHIAPHDIEVRELGTGKSRKEVAYALGINFEVAPNLEVQDGINQVRMLLNKCFFDTKSCARLIEALKHYRREWNEKMGIFKARPVHDWSSHAADAMRYLAVSYKETSALGQQTVNYKQLFNRR